MIAQTFGIPLEEVENRPIGEYRLMRFTVFNMAALYIDPKEFKYMTPEEESDDIDRLMQQFKSTGRFFKTWRQPTK